MHTSLKGFLLLTILFSNHVVAENKQAEKNEYFKKAQSILVPILSAGGAFLSATAVAAFWNEILDASSSITVNERVLAHRKLFKVNDDVAKDFIEIERCKNEIRFETHRKAVATVAVVAAVCVFGFCMKKLYDQFTAKPDAATEVTPA